MKNAFRQMRVTICGKFGPNEGDVVSYVDRLRAKYTAKRGVQMAGMLFQTRSRGNGLPNALNKMKESLPAFSDAVTKETISPNSTRHNDNQTH